YPLRVRAGDGMAAAQESVAAPEGGLMRRPLSLRLRRLRQRCRAGSRRAFAFLAVVVALAVFPRLAVRDDPVRMDPDAVLSAPSIVHPFGTDQFGRDILCRVVFGAQTSLSYALLATAISVAIGTSVGVSAAFYAGRFDSMVMRLIDILMAFPGILLALIVVTLLGPGLTNAMIAV